MRVSGRRSAAFVLAGASVLLLACGALAQDASTGPGRGGFGRQTIPGLTVEPATTGVSVMPGQSVTLSVHVVHDGNTTLNATFRALEAPPAGAPFGGGQRGNFTRPPGGFGNRTGPPPTGSRPRGNGTGGFGRGGVGGLGTNLTFAADPAEFELGAQDEGTVTLTITATATAVPGDHSALFVVMARGVGLSATRFTVTVTGGGTHRAPGFGGLEFVASVLAGLAGARRMHR